MTRFDAIDKLVFLLSAVSTAAFYCYLFIEEVDMNFKIFACTLPFGLAIFIYRVSKEQLIERSTGFYIDLQERMGKASVVLNFLTIVFLMPALLALISGSYTAAAVFVAYGILLSTMVNLLMKRF